MRRVNQAGSLRSAIVPIQKLAISAVLSSMFGGGGGGVESASGSHPPAS